MATRLQTFMSYTATTHIQHLLYIMHPSITEHILNLQFSTLLKAISTKYTNSDYGRSCILSTNIP